MNESVLLIIGVALTALSSFFFLMWKRKRESNIIVFVEKVEYDDQNEVYHLLLDFAPNPIDNTYEDDFISLVNEGGENELVKSQDSSMISIVSLKLKKPILQDHYYIFPSSLTQVKWLNIDDQNRVIGYEGMADGETYEFNGGKEPLFKNGKYSKNSSSIKGYVENDYKEVYLGDNYENESLKRVIVYNVAHGNCNAILTDKRLVFFDFGYKHHDDFSLFQRKVLRSVVIPLRIFQILNENIIDKMMIISHWDSDHYNGLKLLSDTQSSQFNKFYLPNVLPTQTSFEVAKKINDLGLNIIAIDSAKKKKGGKFRKKLPLVALNRSSGDNLMFYKGTKSSSTNKSGLSLTYKYGNDQFILPADLQYYQVDEYLHDKTVENVHLVIPHHGCKAGDNKNVIKWSNLSSITFSSGNYRRDLVDGTRQKFLDARENMIDCTDTYDIGNHIYLYNEQQDEN